MAGLKPRALGVNLLPKARFAPPESRFPVKTAAPKAPAAFDPRADQVLGKYK